MHQLFAQHAFTCMQKLTQNEHSTVSFCFVDRNRTSIHQKRMHTSDLPSSTKLNVHKAAPQLVVGVGWWCCCCFILFGWHEYNQSSPEEDVLQLLQILKKQRTAFFHNVLHIISMYQKRMHQ
jgi:hypothetical protein